MYDNFYVAKSLIEKAIEGTDIVPEFFNGYFSFQTKDLDNSLTNFYIKEDGSFSWEKQEYKYKESAPDSNKKWNFGFLETVGKPELILDQRNAYIDFYDFYHTNEERIFVTFTAHVKDGKLAEEIKLKSAERTNLEEESIRYKKQREEWNRITSTWQWRLATFSFDLRNNLRRLFLPITNKLDKFESSLREEAKKKFKSE